MKKMLNIVLVMVIALTFTFTACQSEQDSAQAPQVGKLAPEFTLPDLDGKSISLGELRGRPVILNFWASWCGPCVFEMPFMQEIHEAWSDKSLVLLAINIGESPSQVQKFMEEKQLSFPVLLDIDGQVGGQYSIRAIPTTVFIDKDGIIQLMRIGAFPSKEALEKELSKIIP